jgi:aerotaxis receptor
MRSNLPVSQQEFPFPSGKTLLSVTDTKGRITYCNSAFVTVSGFAREELLGQAHNLVRHPDMPEEAFRDMWDTIQAAKPWTAVVKNRRKDGDHYWVRANVTPMVDGDKILGYLSVRTEADRAEIEAATALYARMQEEQANGRRRLVLHRGELQDAGLAARWGRQLAWGYRAVGGISALLLVGAMVGLVALAGSVSPALSMVGAATVALLMGGWQQRSARQQLEQVTRDAQQLAACDLTHSPTVGARGPLGQLQRALAHLAVNLRTVVFDSRTEMENVRGAVMEIAAGNQHLSARTEAQASSLEQTAASMEEITGTVRQSADSAGRGAKLSTSTADVSQRSYEAVVQVASSMQQIEESSRRVADIIQVIEGVAFQTNILALNAAVEAARAGEAGRGFAVVAAEVRALAQRTADAAKQIKQLIAESSQRVELGNNQVGQATQRMTEALAAVQSVNGVLAEISTAAAEQQLGISQVNEAVSHMDSMTQQNAAMVEELAAAAAEVNKQVDTVTNTMRLFRLRSSDVSMASGDAAALRASNKSAVAALGGEIDLKEAIAKHMQWKTILRNAAMRGEKLDVAAIRCDDGCVLGQWLYGPGQRRWQSAPDFVSLVDRHRQLHLSAAAVAETISAGKKVEALRMMDGDSPFSQATRDTVGAIKRLMQIEAAPAASAASPAVAGSSAVAARQAPAATAGRAAPQRAAPTASSAAQALGSEAEWESF